MKRLGYRIIIPIESIILISSFLTICFSFVLLVNKTYDGLHYFNYLKLKVTLLGLNWGGKWITHFTKAYFSHRQSKILTRILFYIYFFLIIKVTWNFVKIQRKKLVANKFYHPETFLLFLVCFLNNDINFDNLSKH